MMRWNVFDGVVVFDKKKKEQNEEWKKGCKMHEINIGGYSIQFNTTNKIICI